MFELGKVYSRAEIHARIGGGGVQDYLPSKDGIILAGCFVPELNPRAPEQVYAGTGPLIIAKAERAAMQKRPIPCFLKRANKEFEFVGIYRPTRFDTDPSEVRRAEAETGRNEIYGILHLVRVELRDS